MGVGGRVVFPAALCDCATVATHHITPQAANVLWLALSIFVPACRCRPLSAPEVQLINGDNRRAVCKP